MTQPTHDDERRGGGELIASLLFDSAGRYVPRPGLDVPALILGHLRAAGWVDPEEAERYKRLAGEWRADMEYYRAVKAQRDALLPVVEAARAVASSGPWMRDDMVEDLRAALDALDQKVPETALSATQSAEPCSCGPSCVCHPEPLVDVSGLPLKVLADAAGDTALGRSVARVAGQVAKGEAPITAFSSAVE